MGEDKIYRFARSGREMRPEELSAEVLKSLRGDVAKREPGSMRAVVITVPAAFDLPQCNATLKAAEIAGFEHCVLLQEPVAAALAYGFQSDNEKVYWLVYDLGGGTFDAAIINMRDGMFHVVNHIGNNDLGGKLLDWSIVEELLIPAILKQHKLTDFRRGVPRWNSAMAKLKLEAEEAKIRLSSEEAVEITLDFLCQDDAGAPVSFYYELSREAVERLLEPIVARTIMMCRDVMQQKQLGPGNIDKILLVGGPTLTPYLRKRLLDPENGLGIPLAFEKDPLTIVAQGAAIFASSQRIDLEDDDDPDVAYSIQLEYKPLGSDPEPPVAGKIISRDGADLSSFTIEFVNESVRPEWRSGKVGLSPIGAFMTQLFAEKGIENLFRIELCDARGGPVPVSPDSMTYRIGIGCSEPPLPQSLGVVLANNDVAWFAEKGASLPLRRRGILKTIKPAIRGQKESGLRLPLIQGESNRADRNQTIGVFKIPAENLRRDIPIHSEIEVTIEIDASQRVRMKCYIPIIEEELEKCFDFQDYRKGVSSRDELRKELAEQVARLEKLRKEVEQTGDPAAGNALQRIYSVRMVQEIESSLDGADDVAEVAKRCAARLRELMESLDRVEDALEWPVLVREARSSIDRNRNTLADSDYTPTNAERSESARLANRIEEAIATKDPASLRRQCEALDGVTTGIQIRHPGWWLFHLDRLEHRLADMRDQAAARDYLNRGRQAMDAGDFEGLRAAVRQLLNMLPLDDPDRVSDVIV